MKGRMRGATTVALIMLTVSTVALGAVPPAQATQGQAIIAGNGNGETSETNLDNTSSYGACPYNGTAGLGVCGSNGVESYGSYEGLYAQGGAYGVYTSGSTGVYTSGSVYAVYASGGDYGVYTSGGTGVYATGGGYGVRAYANNTGTGANGVYGNSTNGHGVQGQSTNGTGVSGLGGAYGVFGEGSTGVYGFGNVTNGVFGETAVDTASGVYGQNNGTGYGVAGRATNGTGVLGDGVTGVDATGSTTGVRGASSGAGDGVDGVANNSCCSAVYGQNSGAGNGVAGRADTGTGVLAASTKGTALKVSGKATFSRSGVVTVPAGSSSAQVSLARVTPSSMVIATAQQSSGVSIEAAVPAVPTSGKFTIYLTGNAPVGGLNVAYFVLN